MAPGALAGLRLLTVAGHTPGPIEVLEPLLGDAPAFGGVGHRTFWTKGSQVFSSPEPTAAHDQKSSTLAPHGSERVDAERMNEAGATVAAVLFGGVVDLTRFPKPSLKEDHDIEAPDGGGARELVKGGSEGGACELVEGGSQADHGKATFPAACWQPRRPGLLPGFGGPPTAPFAKPMPAAAQLSCRLSGGVSKEAQARLGSGAAAGGQSAAVLI